MEAEPNAAPAAESRLHFLDYWRILRLRKLVIFIVFLLVVVTTTLITYWLPKTYMSKVQMDVQKDAADINPLVPQPNIGGHDPYFIMTQFERIQSKVVLYRVIEELKLAQRWGTRYGLGEMPLSTAYEQLTRRIDPRNVRNTSIIEINIYSEDKAEAAEIANKIAEVYKSSREEQRKLLSKQGIQTLQVKLGEHNLRVQSAQSNVNQVLQELRVNPIMEHSAGMVATLETETIRTLEQQQLELRALFVQKSTRLNELKKLSPQELKDAILTVNQDELLARRLDELSLAKKELASKSKDLGPLHPEVQKMEAVLVEVGLQIDARVRGIMAGLDTELKGLQASMDERNLQLDKAKELNRQATEKNRKYLAALNELEREQRMRDTVSIKIQQQELDDAIPRSMAVEITGHAELAIKPARPKVALNIALGVVVGLILGIGLAFFIEYLDTSVKTIDDVERALQAPVLAVIPQNVGFLVDEGLDSPHAESYRVLRTNVLFSRKDDKLNAITVVSGGAGEGKSTTALNLATIFAQSGNKVLLVDSDLRRPSLHKRLNLANSPGLTNYLLGQIRLEEVVQKTIVPGMSFLPSGKLPSSAMGILNSPQMREFIQEAKRSYDFVFFDSPPIMGVSDGTVLASEVDLSLLVIQYRKYPQSLATRSRQMVEKVGGRLLGVVLNNINLASDSSYYYYSGYYSHNENKDDGKATRPPGKVDRRSRTAEDKAEAPVIQSKY